MTLKRYNGDRDKVTTVVDFPLIGFEVCCHPTSGDKNKEQTRYDLFGVINHKGNDGEGHYTVFLKRDQYLYKFNDNQVQELKRKN